MDEEAGVVERRPPHEFCRGRVSEDESLEGFARLTQAAERGGVGCLRRAVGQQVVMELEQVANGARVVCHDRRRARLSVAACVFGGGARLGDRDRTRKF